LLRTTSDAKTKHDFILENETRKEGLLSGKSYQVCSGYNIVAVFTTILMA
jgi:hypothetical protein